MPGEEYHVTLEVFEGPLDLLLYLIKKDELEIHDIPIESVTKQYLDYLNLMKILDLNIAGEFLVMAATLMMLKSRMLLPVEERPELDEEEVDPRLDLVRQLVEYKKFKDAAGHLDHLENEQLNVFGREGDHVELGEDGSLGLRDVGIFDLIAAFNVALERAKREDVAEIFEEQFSVAEKIDALVKMLQKQDRIPLGRLFRGMRYRQEIICTFLAMLELMRLKQVMAYQDEGQLGEILLVKSEEAFT